MKKWTPSLRSLSLEKAEGTLWLELWFRMYLPFEVVCGSGTRSPRMSAFSSHVLGLPVNKKLVGS